MGPHHQVKTMTTLKPGCLQEWYCSEHCATMDWRTHRQDCKQKGKTPPPFGPDSAAGEEVTSAEKPAQPTAASKPPPLLAPRREFRTDGTVKIINGYKPDPQMYKGHARFCRPPRVLVCYRNASSPLPVRSAMCIDAARHVRCTRW